MKQTATAKILSLFNQHRQISIKVIRENFPELTCESVRSGIARMIHYGRLQVACRDSKRRCSYERGPKMQSNGAIEECRPTSQRSRAMSNRFYMLCTRETVGSNASFHCHNGNGYSSNIDRAHVYTREEAQRSWELGREIDQPVCADSVDAMAEWHVDCQYIPTESVVESGCDAYVAYKKGSWNGNDVYWLQHGGLPTDDFSKAFIFVSANTEEPGIVWIPFALADKAKRRTFSINEFNRRTMVQAAGLVMPDWLKKQNRREKARSGKVRWNCPCCGKISWQFNPYDFEGCRDINCEGWEAAQ